MIGLLGSFVLIRKTSSESQREDNVYYKHILHYEISSPQEIMYETHVVRQSVCLFRYCQAQSK